MKRLTKRQNELVNSGITLTASEREEIERLIWSRSEPVKPQHLNHYLCLAAIRGSKQGQTTN